MTATNIFEIKTVQEKESTRQKLGQYMTPQPVAEKMYEYVNTPVTDWYVLDPACGDGNLLMEAVDKMQKMKVSNISSRLIGIDIDPKMVERAKQRLSNALNCPLESINIFKNDFLRMTHVKEELQLQLETFGINVVISNPPYGNLREYSFFEAVNNITKKGTEMVFLMPLAFLDRVSGIDYIPLAGRPMGVTTGHAIVHHISGNPFNIRNVKGQQTNSSTFKVLSGVKLYAIGSGVPPQSAETLARKPYSADTEHLGWLPCLRTGDIQPYSISTGRMWVDYGKHLAHPKDIDRFTGPKLFVRRVPIWANKQLGAAYSDELILCAGDVLVIKQKYNDKVLLKGLCVYLNSPDVAQLILGQRPSLKHRMSYPKISAKDINSLIENSAPDEKFLRDLATQYDKLKNEGKQSTKIN